MKLHTMTSLHAMAVFAAAQEGGGIVAAAKASDAKLDEIAGKAASVDPAAAGAAGAADPAAAATAGAGDPPAAAGDPSAAAAEPEPAAHKRFKVYCSRERSPGEIVDAVMAALNRDHVAPADGFVVSSQPAEGGLPAHVLVSFDPDHGAIDRDLVRSAIEDDVKAALKA